MDKKKSYSLYIFSFIIPAVVFSTLLVVFKIAPFGEKAFFVNDMGGQYISFFSYFKQMLAGDKSILFTFAKLIGGDLQGFIAYYLISPFNFLLLFFNTSNMATAVVILMILKIGSCGLTSYIYLSTHSENGILKLIFSTAYALMAYNIVYSQNIMWLDGVIILPIIAMGIDVIIENGKISLYILALVYGIITNYYIGYMLCIFSGMYFVYKMILKNIVSIKETTRQIVDFTVASLISGGLCGVLLLPTLSSLSQTSKQSLSLAEIISFKTNMSLTELIKHMFLPSATMQNLDTNLPNVYVGMLVLFMAVLFFVSGKIKIKEKIVSMLIVILMTLSIYFTSPNLAWHGFAYPVCFPHRFSFIFSFFIILFAFRFLQSIKLELKRVGLVALLILNTGTIFAFGYINIAAIELINDSFKPFYNSVKPSIEAVKAVEGDRFYRMEKDFEYSQNDAMTFGYNGLTHFSSGEKLFTRRLPRIMGYTITEGLGRYNTGSSLGADSFWGIEYLLSKKEGRVGLERVGEQDGIITYKNPYAIPLAIESDREIAKLDVASLGIVDAAGQIMSTALQEDYSFAALQKAYNVQLENVSKTEENGREYYKVISAEAKPKIKYNFKAEQSGNLYILIDAYNLPGVDVKVDGKGIGEYITIGNFGVEYLAQVEKNQDIVVEIEIFSDIEVNGIQFFYDDNSALERMSNTVSDQNVEVRNFNESRFILAGTVEKENSGILVMVPNQKGWQVKAEGAKIAHEMALETFMYIPLEKGEFTLSVKYTPPGLYLGAAVSVVSLVALGGYIYLKRRKNGMGKGSSFCSE